MSDILYRKCSEKEILLFLKNKILNPKNLKFISLSEIVPKKSYTKAKKDTEYLVEYNYNEVLKQGGIKIEYNMDFFKKNPAIAIHVSGAPSIEYFYDNNINVILSNFNGTKQEKVYDFLTTWRKAEQEVVIEKLKLVSGLILNISKIDGTEVSQNIKKSLISLINSKNLNQAFQSDDINWDISQGEMFRPGNNTVNYITDREINPDDILRPLNQDEKDGEKVLYKTGIFKPAVNTKELMENVSLNENEKNKNLIPIILKDRFIYHTSNPMFRQEITKNGLIPKRKSEKWLSDTKIKGKVIFCINSFIITDAWDSGYDDDIYKIDTTKFENKWYLDPNFSKYNDKTKAIITFEKIPASALELVYEGNGKSLDVENNLNEGTGNIYVGIPPESKANRRDIGVKSVSLKQNHTTFTADERKKLADEGKALPDGSYPIRNKSDLRDAIKSYGLGKDHLAAKKHIMKRAKSLGVSDIIPKNWL